ncbi:aconitate hydratase AcnA [Salinibius halmophilus]|uniref:aconitate hydratase AcnA n=1 Tax=Salinibius halmophilus TaxID=1853216 RepID=UPI000E6646F7|nr:aconitate hydratase AcnA [Salinibius halmophilus]
MSNSSESQPVSQPEASQLTVNGVSYHYMPIAQAGEQAQQLPFSLKVLLENLLRHHDGAATNEQVAAMLGWLKEGKANKEIPYRPARVLMQDFTGVPAVVDLAAMRDAITKAGGNAEQVNPLTPVDLVIDHSVMVDEYGNKGAFANNVKAEMARNKERYEFLRWGQQAFDNFRVVPPGTGICHQVNLEYLAQTVFQNDTGEASWLYPDTLVGTDSHTTMINGLGVLGWGVGGIEAEAAMLGQPVSMLIPEVIGFKMTGKLREGITATDLVLTVTQILRKHGVVGKFVEFYGDGLAEMPVADRATIANMAPEYGATCGFFPVDEQTLKYLALTGRSQDQIDKVEVYSKAQGLWRNKGDEPTYTQTLALDLGDVEASLAGPKRPQDRVTLNHVKPTFELMMASSEGPAETQEGKLLSEGGQTAVGVQQSYRHAASQETKIEGESFWLDPGAVVIAAITSCTNTSNPSVMMAAGLLAQKAREKGLNRQPWVKSSLAPGSKVVTDYLAKAGLQDSLDELGFQLVGYGCTTCIGNSGPLPEPVEAAIQQGGMTVASVLSGNRNFEGRVHPSVQTNWLASPPLVVAYALAGNIRVDFDKDPLGHDLEGKPVYLRDIWPSQSEIETAVANVDQSMFHTQYGQVFDGDETWRNLEVPDSKVYEWRDDSTYIQKPSFFDDLQPQPAALKDVQGAKILALMGDSVTTDHISPAGAFKPTTPAGEYLQEQGVPPEQFNSYGSRRGNHEVMVRGTFANVRIRNEMLDGVEGGYTRIGGEQLPIYDAAMRYQKAGTPLVVIAGKEYGTGSSRDWAAKGTRLLGVEAVVAESFERIHRSNLIGMGVMPLQFPEGVDRKTLKLTGDETISLLGISDWQLGQPVNMKVDYSDGDSQTVPLKVRIDTENEAAYFRNGGILHYVLRQMMAK